MKCPCENCKKQMKLGIDELIDEGAPSMVIVDYIHDMTTGNWVECENCKENDFEIEE